MSELSSPTTLLMYSLTLLQPVVVSTHIYVHMHAHSQSDKGKQPIQMHMYVNTYQ